MERYQGVVKWFNAKKGFGFIGMTEASKSWPLPNGQTGDIFVHYTGIQASGYKNLKDGDKVEFSVEEGHDSKVQATQVKLLV